MSRIALINIDTQQSFHHRNYWQEDDIPAFQQAMLGLIEGCQARGIPVVDIFHVDFIMPSRIPGSIAGCASVISIV